MRQELKERILSYNKSIAESKEKASDMDVVVSAIMKLPPGQIKKVLSDEVLEVFRKYGVDV